MSSLTTRINKLRYRYYICDVFTEVRFGGNQLAVLPEAAGLSDRQMQQIAREFNFSETSFVFPAEAGHTRKVRIFTPTTEVPFAGHPNVGTAFALETISKRKVTTTSCCYGKAVVGSGKRRYQSNAQANCS
jgi:PhzF family phenazine biosynthesis protein